MRVNFDKVTYINSELNVLDRNRIIENIKTGIIDIIYLSPRFRYCRMICHSLLEKEGWVY